MQRIVVLFTLIIVSSFTFSNVLACTGLQLKAKDGSFINGRTVEFGTKIDFTGLVIPRNYEFIGTTPDGPNGLKYKAKYAAVGANTFGAPAILDGINEKGLTAAAFYFPGFANYAAVTSENKNKILSPIEFTNWLLTQFATVDEVKNAIHSVVVASVVSPSWSGVPPFHYIVYDKEGKGIVIEPIDGKLKVYDNPIGIITNSPTFDWHLTNLANYMNLSPINVPPINLDGLKLQQFGQGSGLHGLPGDFTPPSRFVRAAVFAHSAIPVADARQTVLLAFHILNQFDIPVGAVREQNAKTMVTDYTMATTVKDPQNLAYYFRTYDDQTIRVIKLRAFDLQGTELKTVKMSGRQPIVDVSLKDHAPNSQH